VLRTVQVLGTSTVARYHIYRSSS